jgi:hypothetical protein
MLGSILGGRWSDQTLRRLTDANDGHYFPEARSYRCCTARSPNNAPTHQMRLESTKPAMVLLPLSAIAYAWFAQKRMQVASLCTALFLIGFFTTYVNPHYRFITYYTISDGYIRARPHTSSMPIQAAPRRLSL